MNEEPKSIWKKSFTGRLALVVWLAVAFLTTMLGCFIIALTNHDSSVFGSFMSWGMFAGVLLVACLLFIYVVLPLARLLFWKHWRRTLFGLACFATLIALFYAEENWRSKCAWNQFKKKWEAQGETFDFGRLIPSAVPDEQNFALTPVIASCYETYFDRDGHEVKPRNTNIVDRLSMMTWRDENYKREKPAESIGWQAGGKMDLKIWQSYFRSPPPTNSLFTNSFPVAPQPQTPPDDVLLALSKFDSVIEEIRQASQLPYSRFPLTYEADYKFGILLPHLAALNSCALALRLRAVAELQTSRTDSACADTRLGLSLVNSLRTEPFMISQLVRLAILDVTLQPVWEGLADHRWSATQLAALDAELAKLDLLADCQQAQKTEIGFIANEIIYLRNHLDFDAMFKGIGFNQSQSVKNEFRVHRLAPGGWFFKSAMRNCSVLMNYLPAVDTNARTISPSVVRRADEFTVANARVFDPVNSLNKMFNNGDSDWKSKGNFLKKFAAGHSSVNLARTAIALERYRLAHGEFPESLDALAPQFITQVPHDVIGGAALKYRREKGGTFTLYSIGWNEKDDGGVVAFSKGETPSADFKQGDWVWRYPKGE